MDIGNIPPTKKQRTKMQNNSLQIYCRTLAQILNESGISYKVFFENLEADYTEEMIRNLFRKFGKDKYGKPKTSEFSTKEIQTIYEEINRHVAKFGIHLPWPSNDPLNY